jgi:arsenite methyltransferase
MTSANQTSRNTAEKEACCAPTCCAETRTKVEEGVNETPSAPTREICCAPTSAGESADIMRQLVRSKYGEAVKGVLAGTTASCCGSKATVLQGVDPITRDLYDSSEAAEVPADAILASFGCGNPTALAALKPGEVVLDLGSGGGIDVLLSARRVGPTGKAYGLDMTPEMLELARKNQQTAGVTNAEFLEGHIEAVPLPDASVDVLISNCVINLSADKDKVLREAFRVLRPNGRFAVSDIVLRRPLPEATRKSVELWAGCVAGALLESDYVTKLEAAGFVDVSIEPTRVYSREDAEEIVGGSSSDKDAQAQIDAVDGAAMSAFIRARKPSANAS